MTNDDLNAADALALSLPDGEVKQLILDLVSEIREKRSVVQSPDYSRGATYRYPGWYWERWRPLSRASDDW